MKHLKKFNESVGDISFEDIKDICLELEDLGMKVSIIRTGYENNIVEYYIEFSTEIDQGIYWNDIKDCLLRLKDYLGKHYCYTVMNGGVIDLESTQYGKIEHFLVKFKYYYSFKTNI